MALFVDQYPQVTGPNADPRVHQRVAYQPPAEADSTAIKWPPYILQGVPYFFFQQIHCCITLYFQSLCHSFLQLVSSHFQARSLL